jgi:VanZ family protein
LLLALAFIVLLLYLGAQPFAVGLFAEPWDKLAHFLAFSALTALLWAGTAGRMPLAVIAMVVAVGAIDEWHQSWLPGRSADIYDLLTDMGAAIVVAAWLQVSTRIGPDKSQAPAADGWSDCAAVWIRSAAPGRPKRKP